MLGQPMSMLIPQVLGFRLHGELPEGATATDLVLTVTEMLRERGVVGKFVEFYGAGLAGLPLADRATIGNMSPEFGSTCAIFPIDAETLTYLELSGRPPEQIALVEAYAKEQGLWHDEHSEKPTFSDEIELDLGDRRAEPRRPQAPAGPRRAERLAGGLPGGAARLRPERRRPGRRAGRGGRRVLPRLRPARQRARSRAGDARASPSRSCRRAARDGAAAQRHRHERDRRRRDLRARPRPRRDRRDHQLHEHVQPVRDGRRGHPRAQRARARAAEQAVGQDLARARLEGRHRIPRPRRADRAARAARLQPRRLRLHDLHRQLGPARAGDLRRPSTRPTWRSSRCSRATATSRAGSTPT